MKTPSRGVRAALVLIALAAATAPSWRSRAQPSDQKAAAEALFQSAKKLADEKKYSEACPKFAESNRLDPGIGVLLYLGDCYEKNGQVASAWATFREAEDAARAAKQAPRAAAAAKRVAALAPRLSRLTVSLAAAAKLPGLEIKRDGAPVVAATLGSPLPVDPGKHTLEASAPGHLTWRREVELKEAADLSIEVPALEAEPAPPPPPPSASAPPPAPTAPPPATVTASAAPPPPQGPAPGKIAGVVVGSLGLVGIGIGAGFGVKTIDDWNAAQAACQKGAAGAPLTCTQAGVDAHDRAVESGIVSTIAISVGAAAFATGLIVFLATPGRKSSAAAPLVVPIVSERVAGAGLVWRR